MHRVAIRGGQQPGARVGDAHDEFAQAAGSWIIVADASPVTDVSICAARDDELAARGVQESRIAIGVRIAQGTAREAHDFV